MKLNIRQFAFRVATSDVAIKDAATVFHSAYVNGDAETQASLRREWMLGYLEGRGVAKPEKVLATGKGAGASKAGIEAIDRASAHFRYHVIRPRTGTVNKTEPVVRISRAHKASALEFLAEFDGETLDAQIAAAIAVLKALKG